MVAMGEGVKGQVLMEETAAGVVTVLAATGVAAMGVAALA